MSLADIAARLVTEGFCTAVGTDVFCNLDPDQHRTPAKRVDNCVMLNDYAGERPITSFGALVRECPRVQVAVRNTVYATGWSKIYSIFKAWYRHEFTVGAVGYYVEALDSPRFLRRDQGPAGNERSLFVCEFQVRKRPS